LWAERFDRDLSDVFVLQDEIVRRIVEVLPDVIPLSRPQSARATNIEAYDLFARARVMVAHSIQNNRASRHLIRKSIELDPGFSDAHAVFAMSHLYGWVYEGEPEEPASSIAMESAQKAVALDPQNAAAHATLGDVHIFKGNLQEGAAELSLALKINPNHADALVYMGELKFYLGNPQAGVEVTRKAFQLNPHPPSWYYWYLGFVEYGAEQYETAVATLMNRSTYGTGSNRLLAASLAQLDRIEEAKREAQVFLALYPHFSSLEWARKQPFKRDSDRQHFLEGYRKAGLPD
jgi:tetratricopeptide (TPR) repeat protein